VVSKSRWRLVSRVQLGEVLRQPLAGRSGRFPGDWWERSGHESAPQAQRAKKSESEPYDDPRALKCCCGRRNWSKHRARLARSRLRTWAPQPIGRTLPVRLIPIEWFGYFLKTPSRVRATVHSPILMRQAPPATETLPIGIGELMDCVSVIPARAQSRTRWRRGCRWSALDSGP
jgi:hypothetical protein